MLGLKLFEKDTRRLREGSRHADPVDEKDGLSISCEEAGLA